VLLLSTWPTTPPTERTCRWTRTRLRRDLRSRAAAATWSHCPGSPALIIESAPEMQVIGTRRLLLTLTFLCTTQMARAGAPSDSGRDHYADLQLAPSVHTGVAATNYIGGVGAEISLHRWLLTELSVSRHSRPLKVSELSPAGAGGDNAQAWFAIDAGQAQQPSHLIVRLLMAKAVGPEHPCRHLVSDRSCSRHCPVR